MHRTDFSYELPPELIAHEPLSDRTASRLLILEDPVRHGRFTDIETLLNPGDVLVLNNTRVLKARLRGEKDSGGQAEVLIERVLDTHRALCMVRVSKAMKAGRFLQFEDHRAHVLGRSGAFYELQFDSDILTVLDEIGEVPLPPYMERAPQAADEARYQTVFNQVPGAVAAPTAGLHFDEPLLERLTNSGVHVAYVTLHVGAGTFQPVRVDDISEHTMHYELYDVSADAASTINAARDQGGRVVAVGTTVVRTLEASCDAGQIVAGQGETNLFITPGYQFAAVDALVTNFHLPESTLLMLVAAFSGHAAVMAAYRDAVAQRYRFFSYGDAMFLQRTKEPADV